MADIVTTIRGRDTTVTYVSSELNAIYEAKDQAIAAAETAEASLGAGLGEYGYTHVFTAVGNTFTIPITEYDEVVQSLFIDGARQLESTWEQVSGVVTLSVAQSVGTVVTAVLSRRVPEASVAPENISGSTVTGRRILTGVYGAVIPFPTRAAAVTWWADHTPPVGTQMIAGGYRYEYLGSGTAIADLPGWVPSGDTWAAHFGFVGNGTAADTAKLNVAIAYAAPAKVLLGIGTYLTANTNVGAASWDNERHIYIAADGGGIIGMGDGATILKRANTERGNVIKIGSRVTETVTVVAAVVQSLSIDGNRANVLAPTATDYHWSNIDVASGCSKADLTDLHIYNAQYYGIGFQRTNFKDNLIQDVVIEDTGADGIDCKDDDGNSSGNRIRSVTVRRFGLAVAGLALQGGINIRSGWDVDGFTVSEFADDSHGIRNEANATTTAQPTTWANGSIKASSRGTTKGVYSNIAGDNQGDIIFANITVEGCDMGFDFRGLWGMASNLRAYDCGKGCRVEQRVMINGLQVRSCTTGLEITNDENVITNFVARSNTLAMNLTGNYNRISNGMISANTTAVTDTGSQNAIQEITGLATDKTVTGSVSIASTGVKSTTIAHGLAFTPSLSDITVGYYRITAVNDFKVQPPVVTTADATNIVVQSEVTTASATAGSTLGIRARCVVKKAPSQ